MILLANLISTSEESRTAAVEGCTAVRGKPWRRVPIERWKGPSSSQNWAKELGRRRILRMERSKEVKVMINLALFQCSIGDHLPSSNMYIVTNPVSVPNTLEMTSNIPRSNPVSAIIPFSFPPTSVLGVV
ncbi:hypothetical protein I308_104617 [Cryptococcus tetragattii IND107]|uniref:Uncharacterized protein n=1 Tax=Cryptococcus tetragattii IND107 TaxID=1296105 RepID=A0ABR3BN52_9TREE